MKKYYYGYFNYFYCYLLCHLFKSVQPLSKLTNRLVAIPLGTVMLLLQVCTRLFSAIEVTLWGIKETLVWIVGKGGSISVLLDKYTEFFREITGLFISPITSLFASIAMSSSMIVNPKVTCNQFVSACERRLKSH